MKFRVKWKVLANGKDERTDEVYNDKLIAAGEIIKDAKSREALDIMIRDELKPLLANNFRHGPFHNVESFVEVSDVS
jgi:hypothetical protein